MFILFFLLWIVFAGELTWHSVLWASVVSVGLHLFCQRILGYPSGFATVGHPRARLAYLGYLIVEILKAALVIIKLVYTKDRDMRPQLVYFTPPVTTEAGTVLLANSITLTAGTIAVETAEGRFCVHALDASLCPNMAQSGFVKRIVSLEEHQWK